MASLRNGKRDELHLPICVSTVPCAESRDMLAVLIREAFGNEKSNLIGFVKIYLESSIFVQMIISFFFLFFGHLLYNLPSEFLIA